MNMIASSAQSVNPPTMAAAKAAQLSASTNISHVLNRALVNEIRGVELQCALENAMGAFVRATCVVEAIRRDTFVNDPDNIPEPWRSVDDGDIYTDTDAAGNLRMVKHDGLVRKDRALCDHNGLRILTDEQIDERTFSDGWHDDEMEAAG